jgi:hypothetical protein
MPESEGLPSVSRAWADGAMTEGERLVGDVDTAAIMAASCDICRHRTGALTCRAYPAGIPPMIFDGQADHRRPHPGDGGIRYEPAWPSSEGA